MSGRGASSGCPQLDRHNQSKAWCCHRWLCTAGDLKLNYSAAAMTASCLPFHWYLGIYQDQMSREAVIMFPWQEWQEHLYTVCPDSSNGEEFWGAEISSLCPESKSSLVFRLYFHSCFGLTVVSALFLLMSLCSRSTLHSDGCTRRTDVHGITITPPAQTIFLQSGAHNM